MYEHSHIWDSNRRWWLRTIEIWIVVVSASAWSAIIHGAEPENPVAPQSTDDTDDIGRRMLQDDYLPPNDSIDRFFANEAYHALADLRRDRSVSVALRAAWEEVLRDTPFGRGGIDDAQAPLQPYAVERLIGYSEGRLGITLPEWWRRTVRSGGRGSGGSVDFDVSSPDEIVARKVFESPSVEHEFDPTENWLRVRTREGRWVDVSWQLLGIDRGLSTQPDWEPWNVIVAEGNGCLFVSADRGPMESYPLLCIDVADSTLKWSVKVPLLTVAWSGPPIGMIHANEFRLAEDTIYVIGATAFSLYIEGYSVVTGTMTARFRTE